LKLPENTVFASEKFNRYLLIRLPDNDKSIFLESAGYSLQNWQQLLNDLKVQFLKKDASLLRRTPFGTMYEIRGFLKGPNERELKIVTVWMVESGTNISKFITLYPDKEK
jgi:hypothetical protein